MIKNRGVRHGFTIVELLIVIVVIAVLAAISIVTFTSVQARAENTKTTQAVASVARALGTYAAEAGRYPGSAEGAWICLPVESSFCGSSQNSPSCFGLNRTPIYGTMDIYLSSVVSSLPETSSQEIDCGDGRVVVGGFYRLWPGNKQVSLLFFLRGDVECPSIAGKASTKELLGSATRCITTLPNLS